MTTIDFSDPRIAAIEVTPMWSGELHIDVVDSALKAYGVPDELLPKQPSRAVCMRRAFDACAPRGAKIDMLSRGQGVALSLKDVAKLDLEELTRVQGYEVREAASYFAMLTAKILVVNTNGTETETVTFSPEDHPLVPLIREMYTVKREQYKLSEDLSVWFSQTIIHHVGGVGKRSRGGVYYVPSSKRDLLLKISDALNSVSSSRQIDRVVAGVKCPVHRLVVGGKLCIEPRAVDDASAMEIMIDGVIRQTDGTLDDLAGALSPAEGKKPLGKRGLASKQEECAQLEKEIAAWENVCSTSLDLLRDRLSEIQAALCVAELQAEAAEL